MKIEQTTDLERRARRHAALADVTRLRIVDALALSDRSVSVLAATLALPSNLLAHHLKVLEEAGLVGRHRSEGDGRRTYVSLAREAGVPMSPLRSAGGADGPAATGPVGTGSAETISGPVEASRVVFVCTANTARSHLAAALWREASTVETVSAGTHPGERIAAGAVAAAGRHELALPEVAPRGLDGLLQEGDLVVTVCDRAHEDLDGLDWAHWSIPDPVRVATDEAFDRAYAALEARVAALAPVVAPLS